MGTAINNISSIKNKFDNNIESIRGFSALFVAIGHGFMDNALLNPDYEIKQYGIIYPGHYCVLVFFVLSGYVIGISNKTYLTTNTILPYLKKRLLRLYPIYVISILFALAVAQNNYSTGTIISNLAFTQIILSDLIRENSPLWSLHYEVLYYLIFIPISFFKINPITAVIFSIAIGLGNYFLYPIVDIPIISSYLFGFAFWSSGLIIAKYFTQSRTEKNYSFILSSIFLLLCIGYFNVITTFFTKLTTIILGKPNRFSGNISWYEKAITFSDLTFLPYCLMFILLASGKEFKYKNMVFTFLQLLPTLTFIYIIKNLGEEDLSFFIIPSVLYIISVILFFNRSNYINAISKPIIKTGSWLGSLSFGIYVVHVPIIYLFNKINSFSGSGYTFAVRFGLFLIFTIIFSYLLEKKVQPWIRNKFD